MQKGGSDANKNMNGNEIDLFNGKQKCLDKEIYHRQRQSFMATKVNIQQISNQDQIFSSMSTYYGFAVEKTPLF